VSFPSGSATPINKIVKFTFPVAFSKVPQIFITETKADHETSNNIDLHVTISAVTVTDVSLQVVAPLTTYKWYHFEVMIVATIDPDYECGFY
jgi:hypothetical protein